MAILSLLLLFTVDGLLVFLSIGIFAQSVVLLLQFFIEKALEPRPRLQRIQRVIQMTFVVFMLIYFIIEFISPFAYFLGLQ
jgi:hypothetical protein